MALVTKESDAIELVRSTLSSMPGVAHDVATFHRVAIDEVGLIIREASEIHP